MTIVRQVTISLPPWVDDVLARHPAPAGDEERMRFVLDVAGEQVRQGTGGPFAAAVFSGATGELLSVGMNLVVRSCAAIAHAEAVALALAGQRVGSYDLSGVPAVLLSTAEPCAMCLGAIPWAGVARLVCAASDEDARAIGFDEGNKPANWVEGLERRGIEVTCGVLREEAVAVLRDYVARGGPIYNGATPVPPADG
ncbi:MAG TPA: nucleoside deaminase [Acidimicrobiales bacterium]|jgi:tRNA(Arg) A34 adenosine deaminase TadA